MSIGCIDPIICLICVFSSSLRLRALLSCFLMTSFTSLSITPLVCNAASKLNWAVHKNSTCYSLTTKTVNKTPQWFQNKTSSCWRCSIKKVFLKILQCSQEKPAAESLFNKVAGHIFSTEPLWATASGINVLAKIWN